MGRVESAFGTATAATPIPRARMAVCEVAPPDSVINPAYSARTISTTSAGDNSRATKIRPLPEAGAGGGAEDCAARDFIASNTRLTTWAMSLPRSRR